MTHNYIEVDAQAGTEQLVIHHHEYNLDKKDNLDSLPAEPAVYAICGRVNGQPVNARYVGTTTNLAAAVKAHYLDTETNEGLLQFMRSIKTKTLVYKVLAAATEQERENAGTEWENKFNPTCTDELNRVY